MTDSAAKRKTRCIIIGAGVSGILMGIKLQEAFKDTVDFWIFEKNAELGGTWFENRYPGCACDVPSHLYQFTFAPNPNWASFYASSKEIQSYLKAVAAHYDVDSRITFNSSVLRAEWNETRSIWTIDVQDVQHECEILVNAGGILNHINVPQIHGLDRFLGDLLHTAAWDNSVDLRDKRVAIIGAGASAIQVLPAIQDIAAHVDIHIRTPSWITPPVGETDDWKRSHMFSVEEKNRFRNDPDFYLEVRKQMETGFNSMYKAFIRGTDEQRSLRETVERSMRDQISSSEMQRNLIPSFDVGCRRINPGQPYLEALQRMNVQPLFGTIDEVTTTGIISDGVHRETDIIIAATGFNTSFRPRFPIIGRDGVDLQQLWSEDPVAYCGLAVSGFPNYLMFLGPNTPISNGSLIGTLESTVEYFIRLIDKFIKERALSFDVRPDAQSDFDAHTQKVMKDMVWTSACSSWYKGRDGKIRALWPGSMLHYRDVLASNRWEDYAWKYRGNRFEHWGHGLSHVEQSEPACERDLAYYIKAHEPLPLDAYYLVATRMSGRGTIPEAFRPVRSHIAAEANSHEANSPLIPEASSSKAEMNVGDTYKLPATPQLPIGGREALSAVAVSA